MADRIAGVSYRGQIERLKPFSCLPLWFWTGGKRGSEKTMTATLQVRHFCCWFTCKLASSPSPYGAGSLRLFFSSPRRSLYRRCGRGQWHPRARPLSASSSSPASQDGGSFFADENVSWKSLGVSDQLCLALSASGFHRPSLVQVKTSLQSGSATIRRGSVRPLEEEVLGH